MNVELLSLVLNFILGGSGLVMLFSIRSMKKKAEGDASQSVAQAKVVEAEAEGKQIENMLKIAEAWENQTAALEQRLQLKDEQSIELSKQVAALSEQVNKLTKEVTGLRKQTTRMIELIDIITPDNLDEIKLKIKKLHEDNQA
jgi:hypothetical protein